MSENRPDKVPMVPLTPNDLARFRRDAPAAAKRRGAGFFVEQWAYSFEVILLGTVPIVGLLAYDWSGLALFVFMLVGVWTAIGCDLVKYAFLRPTVREEGEQYTNDHFVWVVADALRENRREIQANQTSAAYHPGVGLVADLLFGGVSTGVMMAVMWTVWPESLGDLFGDPAYLLGLVGLTLWQAVMTGWVILEHQLSANPRPIKLHAGLRGAGLFILMFIVLIVSDKSGDKTGAARIVMLVVNGLFILLGLLNAFGMIFVRQETIWLKDYLRGGHSKPKHKSEPDA